MNCKKLYAWLSIERTAYKGCQEKCARLREGVPYVKVYRNNPKHLCLKLNGYGDNGQRKVWYSGGSTHQSAESLIYATSLSMMSYDCSSADGSHKLHTYFLQGEKLVPVSAAL